MSRPGRVLARTAAPVRRRARPGAAERRVAVLGLRPADVAIDCGANVGDVTAAFHRRSAFVYAFEPSPDAFAVLSERFREEPGVELHPRAVLDRGGTARLHLCVDAVDDPVEAVDLAEFVLDRIGTVLVELHDRHVPELRHEYDDLRERLARDGLTHRVLTDWE